MDKISFFEVLGLPVSLDTDKNDLRKKYYQLSRQYHPDILTSTDDSDQSAYERINEAYETLSDKWKRIKHLLDLNDMLLNPEHEKLPADFLQDMMDINEILFELQMEDNEKLRDDVISRMEIIAQHLESEYENILSLFENQEDKKDALIKLKDYYLKSKYILRIQENLSTFVAGSRGIED